MTTLQTGTKVLIEATVEATKDNDVHAVTKSAYVIRVDKSDLTVCETAQPIDKDNWKVKADDPNYHEVGKALFDKHDNWKDFDVNASGSVGKVYGYSKYNIVSPVPTITGQQALRLLGVEMQPIDLQNFCIDITDPVNAELLPGFKEWFIKKNGYTLSWECKYYGFKDGAYDASYKVALTPICTLTELRKQHPGVFEKKQKEVKCLDCGKVLQGEIAFVEYCSKCWENQYLNKPSEQSSTPSFKAGQEVEGSNQPFNETNRIVIRFATR